MNLDHTHISNTTQTILKDLQTVDKREPTNSQMNLSKALEQDNVVLALKHSKPSIVSLPLEKMADTIKALLIRIHAITGWILPTGATLNALQVQLGKKLLEDYDTINEDEIEYAFRKGAWRVSEWGKNFNLGLFDTIMKPYLVERYDASIEEEKEDFYKNKTFDLRRDVNWRYQVQENYNYYIHGSKYYRNWRHIHPFEYDVLESDGFIERRFYKWRLQRYQQRLRHPDNVLAEMAKGKSVEQLFRLAVKQQRQFLYSK
jgi:hypothetical protein